MDCIDPEACGWIRLDWPCSIVPPAWIGTPPSGIAKGLFETGGLRAEDRDNRISEELQNFFPKPTTGQDRTRLAEQFSSVPNCPQHTRSILALIRGSIRSTVYLFAPRLDAASAPSRWNSQLGQKPLGQDHISDQHCNKPNPFRHVSASPGHLRLVYAGRSSWDTNW